MELSKVVYSICAVGSFLSLIAYASFNAPSQAPGNVAPNIGASRVPNMMAPNPGQGRDFLGADGQAADGWQIRTPSFAQNTPATFVGEDGLFYTQPAQNPRIGYQTSDAANLRGQNIARTFVARDGLYYAQAYDGSMMVLDPLTRNWRLLSMPSYAYGYSVPSYPGNYWPGYYAAPYGANLPSDPRWWFYNQPNGMEPPAANTGMTYRNVEASSGLNAANALLGSDGQILFN